jgi:hypothetical protein
MIVIRCNVSKSAEEYTLLWQILARQGQHGLILLPEECTLEAVTDGGEEKALSGTIKIQTGPWNIEKRKEP